MSKPNYSTSQGYPGVAVVVMSQVVDNTDTPFTQSALSSITYKVWPLSNPRDVTSGTLTISSVVYNTLQTGSGWKSGRLADQYTEGFNFRAVLAGTLFPKENETYRIHIRLVPNTGDEGPPIIHDHTTCGMNER